MLNYKMLSKERMKNETVAHDETRSKEIYPETSMPTICLRIPEMKNELSYWLILSSPVTRLKINTLREDVKIRTEEAGEIEGMFAEWYKPVATLGTAIVHIFNRPVKVHVTRSKRASPIVCDGVLGNEFLNVAYGSPRNYKISGIPQTHPIATGEELIADYNLKLHRAVDEGRVAYKDGQWATISDKLSEVRKFLPSQVADNSLEPVLEILEDYAHCFHLPGEKLTCTKLLKYKITSSSNKVVNVPQPVLTSKDWNKIDSQIESWLRDGIIQPSDSPYNSPICLIKSKPVCHENTRYYFAPDFHELEKKFTSDTFPIPDIVQLTDVLHGSKYFSIFNLASACYQIELEPEDRRKTAFSTRTKRYEFLRMPLGIRNASQNIQRLLNRVLDDMLYSPSMAFVIYDDIIVHAATIEEHEVRVRKLFSRIETAGLKLQPSKCQMFSKSVRYFGHLVTDKGLRPDPDKIQRIRDYELPKNRHSFNSFLGLSNCYQRFVPNYAEIIKPMNDSSSTNEIVQSFEVTKTAFSKELLLRYPNWDETFILETNTSDVGVQAVLLQKNPENRETFTIAYSSRCYTPEESSYKKFNKAHLAAIHGMDTWYRYLNDIGYRKIILRTPEPSAFNWYIQRQCADSDILEHFALLYCGIDLIIEPLYPNEENFYDNIPFMHYTHMENENAIGFHY